MQRPGCEATALQRPDPCLIVIFGGSGDLTRRKLIPALHSLYLQGGLPERFAILGCARTAMNDEGFRQLLIDQGSGDRPSDQWTGFASRLHYLSLSYDDNGFATLADALDKLDDTYDLAGNILFDLAVPPSLYPVIGELLGKSGLAGEEKGWRRIVVEKPFGHDLASAQDLNRILHRWFREEQIFRIDHYLAKETVQNLLIFRFANAIFEPVWNRRYIAQVGIVATETLGVEKRAGYYDRSGVLRDMFQNHLMQLLVLTGMEPPYRLIPDAVQDEKVKVIRSLRPFTCEHGSSIILGQYGPGRSQGEPVPGYRQEKGVHPDSRTPTFGLMRLFVDNWRWQDVPFFLISGKRLQHKRTRIVIQFKEVPHHLFRDLAASPVLGNRLVIEAFPEESIRLTFQTKNPGPRLCLRPMTMEFTYREHFRAAPLDAYARVLLDCMLGDHMLFWRQDGIEAAWSFLTPILRECEPGSRSCPPLYPYPSGSWGPDIISETVQSFAA